MLSKIRQISNYLLFTLLFIAIYGSVLYFPFKWLSAYSHLYAFLGNFALIVIILAADELTLKMLQSEEFVMQMRKKKDTEKIYHSLQKVFGNIISFKTGLYLFYVLILIGSLIIELDPTLVGENLGDFIHANNYSILLLIALDMLIGQFSKDRERMKKIPEKLKISLTEKQE